MSAIINASYIFSIAFLLYSLNRRNILGFLIRNQKFKCTNCVRCCKLLVRLTPEDIERIKRAGYKEEHFAEKKKNHYFLKRVNNYCIFLSVKEGKGRCMIYEDRPNICRNYPRITTFFGIEGNNPRCDSFKVPWFL